MSGKVLVVWLVMEEQVAAWHTKRKYAGAQHHVIVTHVYYLPAAIDATCYYIDYHRAVSTHFC